MNNMKKIIFLFLSALMLLTGCYPDYVRDYDEGTGVYTAYQYDLRSFVMGENESFDFTVALGGVISNDRDRKVKVVLDNSLLTSDLAQLAPEKNYPSFTALNAILGAGSFGNICQKYVTDDVKAAGITALAPLPESYYKVSGLDAMTIKKGRHTAAVTIKATDFIKEDPKVFAPYYALAFRIESADADHLDPEKSFEVIVVRCENKFFGDWKSTSGTAVYTMNTKDDRSLYVTGLAPAKLVFTFNDDNTVSVSSADPSLTIAAGATASFNGAKLLQDRVINVSFDYTYQGQTQTVNEEMKFQSRVRDGVLEWQDENPENYK